MLLCLDVGNSHIFGGVFIENEIHLQFRYNTKEAITSDQLGLFLKNVLRENGLTPEKVQAISISSVVPGIDYSLRSACIKYFQKEPFMLRPDSTSDLKLEVDSSSEVGADRLANAIASTHRYPGQNLIIVSLGTATTFCAVTADKAFLGGVIMPGMKLSMNALQLGTAKLPPVEILKPPGVVGKNTITNIQSGLYYGQLGAIQSISKAIAEKDFHGEEALVIGTGGFASLFESEKCFHHVIPDLVLKGLKIAFDAQKN